MTRSRKATISLIHNYGSYKAARTLTIRIVRSLLSRRALDWRSLLATRAVPPDLLYPARGPHGGYMIPIVLRDGRKGRADTVIHVEMEWINGYGWYPCDYKLTLDAAAAVCGVAKWTMYRIGDELESRRKIFKRVFFMTQQLFEEIDLADELARRVERKKGGRPGPHAEFCAGDPNHRGACAHARFCTADAKHTGTCEDPRRRPRRPKKTKDGWTIGPRSPRVDYRKCDPDAEPEIAEDDGTRQTWTEALINETESDPARRDASREELRGDIEAERKARNFVPKGEEVE